MITQMYSDEHTGITGPPLPIHRTSELHALAKWRRAPTFEANLATPPPTRPPVAAVSHGRKVCPTFPRRRQWPPDCAHAAWGRPFRDPLLSGSKPNEVVNPKGSVNQRAREFRREIGPRAGPAALSPGKQRTLGTRHRGRKSLRRLRKNENAESSNSRRFE